MFNNYYTKVKCLSACLIFLLVVIYSACQRPFAEPAADTVQSLVRDSAMVVAEHPLAAGAGAAILREGGNAVDAAIATQFTLAVVQPRAGNIGGGGFMILRMAEGETAALDFREKAPALAHRDMYLDSLGNVVAALSKDGHLSVGVPGTVAGMEAAFKRFSLLKDWPKLLAPAIRLAEEGFNISESEARRLNEHREIFLKLNPGGAPFIRDAQWKAGDLLVQQDLARTLRLVSEQGAEGFYAGETADKIVAEMQRGGGLISLEDLKNYEAKWRHPITGKYRDCRIVTMPPPSSGGIALMQLLSILEKFPLNAEGFQSAVAVHAIVEAERRVYADRAKYLGDSDFYAVPVDSLLDLNYLSARMSDFDPDKATPSDSVGEKIKLAIESFETTHFSVVDGAGNAVAVTTTLNLNYGSKVVVQGAGFFLNDEMDDFSAKPGVPNYFGLVGTEANAIEPGKRMLSSMTPTIVEKEDRLFMALGSPGGSTIITSVLQTILNVAEYDMSLDQAVKAPRFHHQWLPDIITCEPTAIDTIARKELWDMGHTLGNTGRIGFVNAILILPNGQRHGVADPRSPENHAAGF